MVYGTRKMLNRQIRENGVKRSLFKDFSMRIDLFVTVYVGKTMHFYNL